MREWIINTAFTTYEIMFPIFGVSFLAIFFVFIPLGLFDKTRRLSANSLIVISYIFGFGVWVYSAGLAFALWGWIWLILGLLIFGVGVVFIAFLATMLNGLYGLSIWIVLTVVFVYGLRYLGYYLADKDDGRKRF